VSPTRRCVGCGRSAPKTELLRVALAAAPLAAARESERPRAIVDRAGTLPGRGAYLCRAHDASEPARVERACLRRATRRGALARALRAAVTLDRELVESPEAGEAGRSPASRAPLFFIPS